LVSAWTKVLKNIMRQKKTWWLQAFQRRAVTIDLDIPVVSLTFDDIPQSTFASGIPLLNLYGIKATFYACLGMPDSAQVFGPAELRWLLENGHEVACHTYSHYNLSMGTVNGLAQDARRNREAFKQLLNSAPPENFSFPFGKISHQAKRVLSTHYRTMRSSRPGVNSGSCDFNCLLAVSLQHKTFSHRLVKFWLDIADQRKGWLIFYTHGITTKPKLYDITPKMLDVLLDSILRRDFPILTISQAADLVLFK
jgi:peptidoglycan/xylan/chitin deacetylase (PgdA/CDA1 family)